jgi:predicted outer membrane protein
VGGTSETYQKLLEKSGTLFDQAFVRLVAQLSTDTLTLFEQVASESKDSDVRELAAAQLPLLRGHRTTIAELKKTFD